ncbi:MAG: HTH domain-containing protein [Clostridiales bacterium]|nr:HTH domain-containing protein [Clostridiales bacterium]
MNSTYLNAKCKGILRKLLNNNSYLSLQQLAEELNISQRSIYSRCWSIMMP